MKYLAHLFTAAVILLSFSVFAAGQQEIPESKRKLIEELMVITETRTQITEITDSSLAAMETMYPMMMEEMISERTDLTDEQKAKVRELASEGYKQFSSKFRERLPKSIDYDKYIRESIHPLYDRHFTEKELADLIAFYKTPTGQKVVKEMPKLYDETITAAQTDLLPEVMKLIEQIMEETFGPVTLKGDGDAPASPPPAKPKDG